MMLIFGRVVGIARSPGAALNEQRVSITGSRPTPA
jgi:hypothetical protein